jgi:hypothetical protein
MIHGGICVGYWGVSALFSGMSLYKLYQEWTMEHPAARKFAKICEAVKTAFVDLISLGEATVYSLHWAHQIKVITLGRYAPLFEALRYGSSLMINCIEGGWSIYNITLEKEAILKRRSPKRQVQHRQRCYLFLIKLIGNICMVAWAALEVASFATGFAINSSLASAALSIGCLLSVAAFFYQKHFRLQ